jgi:hypothetical protein
MMVACDLWETAKSPRKREKMFDQEAQTVPFVFDSDIYDEY